MAVQSEDHLPVPDVKLEPNAYGTYISISQTSAEAPDATSARADHVRGAQEAHLHTLCHFLPFLPATLQSQFYCCGVCTGALQ